MNLLKEIWKFSVNPTIENHLDDDDKLNVIRFLKLLLIFYGLIILGSIPSTIISESVNNIFAIDLVKIRNDNFNSLASGFKLFIMMVLLAPLLEEVMFRLWLSFKKVHVIISLTTIFFILIKQFDSRLGNNFKIDTQFLIIIGSAILLGSLIGYIIFLYPIKKLVSNNFKYFYWFSCIGFGLVHITNFSPLYISIFWAYPFLVIPQLIMGFGFGYFRMKRGFFVALLFHCLINLPAAMIFYFHRH
jgi:hypothetical protein